MKAGTARSSDVIERRLVTLTSECRVIYCSMSSSMSASLWKVWSRLTSLEVQRSMTHNPWWRALPAWIQTNDGMSCGALVVRCGFHVDIYNPVGLSVSWKVGCPCGYKQPVVGWLASVVGCGGPWIQTTRGGVASPRGGVRWPVDTNNPWWAIDLGAPPPVTAVLILPRDDCCGIVIYVSLGLSCIPQFVVDLLADLSWQIMPSVL